MKEFKYNRYIYMAIVAFFLAFGLYIFFVLLGYGGNINNWGQFGNYLGVVLSLIFAFLSLIAVLYAINLQRQSIIDTKKDVNKQRSIAQEQNDLLGIQRFDTTFFNMLDQIENIVNAYTSNKKIGAPSFQDALVETWRKFKEKNKDSVEIDKFFKSIQYHIEYKNFVLHIANIIKIIQTSNLKQEDKFRYYEILNGYLTNRQKYFMEVCSNCSFFKEVKEQIKLIHRSEKKWEQ